MRHEVPTIQGIPVLLPPHDHPEFGTPGQHYHVDFRYCSDEPRQDRVLHSNEKPIVLSFELVRKEYTIISGNTGVVLHLADKYAGQKHKDGKCPHKGLPVYGGICTGHGIAFDEDGYVITDYYMDVGGTTQNAILGQKRYEFIQKQDAEVDGVRLFARCGMLVSFLPFTTGPILVNEGDKVKVNV